MHEKTRMRLNYYDYSWPLVDYSPDRDFVAYLTSRSIKGKLIFHFGTGEHHLVGKHNHERGNPNEIFAITASREEYRAYVDFVINNPVAANSYKALFGDIYTLSPRMLPDFDIVTLFHLGECYDQQIDDADDQTDPQGVRLNSAYSRLDDATLLDLFLHKLSPGGKILFFKRSGGLVSKREPGATVTFNGSGGSIKGDRRVAKIINDYLSRGQMVIEGEYETLLICGRPVG